LSIAVTAEQVWCVVVPHQPRGARVARQRLSAALAGLVTQERLSDAMSVAAELVGNAVRHAMPLPGGVVRVAWHLLVGGGLLIKVTDGGSADQSAAPMIRPPSADAVDGRGLAIVAALSRRWGVERDGLGQCVWAELQ
jgi:anti-sigma regulatory factor (Ser/Thr protein kinase)